MKFAFTEDQQFLERAAEKITHDVFSPTQVRDALRDPHGDVRPALWSTISELGWPGVLVPAEAGGSGGSVIDACILAEALAGVLAPVPFVATAFGVASLCVAVGDTDTAGALLQGDPLGLVLDRRLQWPTSDACCVWGWLPGAEAVQLDVDGRIARSPVVPAGFDEMDPLHPIATVAGLDPARPASSDGVRRAIAITKVGITAAATGLARAALEEAVAYAKEREQYGRPIGDFQAVQHICADMLVDVQASRSLCYGAAWTVEHETVARAERIAAAASAWCLPAAVRVVESGIQVLGGIGVTWEHDAHLRLRHAQLLNRLLGGARDAEETLGAIVADVGGVNDGSA